jgi:excinuclease ABC subunit C
MLKSLTKLFARVFMNQNPDLPKEIGVLLNKLPDSPGVYRFYDASGDLLYVGKAKILKNRVRSYFHKSANHGARTRKLVEKITNIQWVVTQSETEALLLEANLIHNEQPPFNVVLRDDKHFLYVKIGKEAYPRVEFTRKKEEDGAMYFGPYVKASHIRKTLDFLREVLQFRTCKVGISPGGTVTSNPEKRKIPCLDYQIHRCTAPCDNRISMHDYHEEVMELADFLRGKTTSVKRRMKLEMMLAAEKKEFERAARFRDLLNGVEEMDVRQAASVVENFSADIIGFANEREKSFFHVFYIRHGKIIRSENFVLQNAETRNETFAAFLRDYLSLASEIPPLIIIPDLYTNEECTSWSEYAATIGGHKVEVRIPQKAKKKELLELACKNANLQALNTRASFQKTEVLEDLKKALELPRLPERIECYDISHLSGTHPVGSRVVFIDGKPAKGEYRKYKMRSLPKGKIDDFAAMAELLGRRLRKLERGVEILRCEQITDPERVKEIDKELEEAGLLSGKDCEQQYAFIEQITGKTVGYARIRRWGKMAEIGGVIVLPEFRTGGMGTEIIKTLVLHSDEKIIRAFIRKERLRWKVSLKSIGFNEEKKPPKAFQAKIDQRKKDEDVEMIVMKVVPNDLRKAIQKIPDLLVIDGGKGQLSSVVKVLRKYNLFRKIPVCSIAKRNEEIYIPGSGEPLPIPQEAPENLLLQEIRDEAHRVAVTFNKQQRKAAETKSQLDEIPGIGTKTRQTLLKAFGSVQAILQATDEELLKVIPASRLETIREHQQRMIQI